MLKKFWSEQDLLIKISGFIAALGALFLSIPTPENHDAQLALGNIKIFWLILLTACLTVLSVQFVKLLIRTEKEIEGRYDVPGIGTFSITVGALLFWLISNFWIYILSLYPVSFGNILLLIFPGIIMAGCFFLLLATTKHSKKITLFSRLIVESFAGSMLISTFGLYIQQIVLKYFYWYWAFPVLPGLFIGFLIVFVAIAASRKQQLFS